MDCARVYWQINNQEDEVEHRGNVGTALCIGHITDHFSTRSRFVHFPPIKKKINRLHFERELNYLELHTDVISFLKHMSQKKVLRDV